MRWKKSHDWSLFGWCSWALCVRGRAARGAVQGPKGAEEREEGGVAVLERLALSQRVTNDFFPPHHSLPVDERRYLRAGNERK